MSTFTTSGNLVEPVSTFVTSVSPIVLTAASLKVIVLTGVTAQTLVLPDATTCILGMSFLVINTSTLTCTLEYDDNTPLGTVNSGSTANLYLINNSTSNGTWVTVESGGGGGGGSGEFTQIVGSGPGEYATLTAVMAIAVPGDSILVKESYTITAAEDLNVSNISVTFMPDALITVQIAGGISALIISGDRVRLKHAQYAIDVGGALTNGIAVSGDDVYINDAFIDMINAVDILTNAYRIQGTSFRTYLVGAVKNDVAATVTNTVSDGGTDTDASVRG